MSHYKPSRRIVVCWVIDEVAGVRPSEALVGGARPKHGGKSVHYDKETLKADKWMYTPSTAPLDKQESCAIS